jgi:tripartite-type tricarboxylate transporter receptor subunit TctC
MGQNLSEVLGQQFVIDNRAGANGAIGAELAAKATPDGYTLFMSTNTTSAANPSLMKKINYDPVKDFAPIARIGTIPFVLVVHPSVPAKSVKEIIDACQAAAGQAHVRIGQRRQHAARIHAAADGRHPAQPRAVQEAFPRPHRRDRRPDHDGSSPTS